MVRDIYIAVSPTNFQTSAAVGFNVDIQSSSINYGDGNYLMVTLQSFDSGATWVSSKIPISKSPVFSLTPSNVEIPCGSISPITFSCTNNINSGVYSYSWNVGNGWSHNGNPVSGNIVTTSSSITLQPTNPNTLPSRVSVTPTWNNMIQNTITSHVKRKIFDENIIINGLDNICSYPATSVYIVNTSNEDSIIWTSSDIQIAEVLNSIGNSVTLNIKKAGLFTLSANVTNLCNQNKILTKKIWVGKPSVELQPKTVNNYVYLDVVGLNGLDVNEQKITNIVWEEISNSGGSCTGSLSSTGGFKALVHGNCFSWTVRFRVSLTNSCGTTTIEREVTPRAPDPCNKYIVSKTNNGTYRIIDPCRKLKNTSLINQEIEKDLKLEIYNASGQQVLSTNKTEFSINHLLKGNYFIQIIRDNEIVHNQILIKD